jgi:secondary thiamine-phosphate synthase enzyme
MKIVRSTATIESSSQVECIDITDIIRDHLMDARVRDGLVCVFVPHTTAGIMINHNEPFLLRDVVRMLYKIAPVEDQYAHDLFESKNTAKKAGRSNGHSHTKALLLGTSETIFIEDGSLILSQNQSVFFVECDGPQKRSIMIQVMGQ